MANTNPNSNTGVSKLNANLRDAAASLGGPALQLATGAKLTDVAAHTLKDSALSSLLGPTALFASGLLGILGTIKKIVAQTGILDRGLRQIAAGEQIQGKFETLLKSAVLAKKRIQELYAFTANSPFKFDDVAEANRILQALTNGALAGAKGMTLVGDVAAATGEQISTTAEKVGKAYNALSSGRSLDRILFQLQATGAISDTVAKQLEELENVGAGFGEKWGAVEEALRKSQGGMKNESTSLDALAAKLENAGARLEKAFAAPFKDAQAKSLQVSIDATENVTPVLAEINSDIAPLLTLTTTFKNTITESTLATKGFAEALGIAWQIGKVAFAGIGLATLGKLTTGLGSVAKFATGTLTGAARSVFAAKQPGGGLAQATGLFGKAGAALTPGGEGLVAAASLAIEATALKAATLAGIVHAQAMTAVGTTTGVAAAANYVAATAVTVFGGAMNLAKRAAIGLAVGVRASFAALLTNPFTATLIGIGAVITGFAIWKRSIEETDRAYSELAEQIAATNKKLVEQAAAVSTTEEWTKSVNDLTEAYGKAKDALADFQSEQAKKNPIAEAIRNFLNPDRASKRDAARNQLEGAITNTARLRDSQLERIGNTGLSDREKDQFKTEIAQREALREQKFQQDFQNADAEKANQLATERIELLKKEAAAGRAAEDARTKFDRSDAGKKAVRDDLQLRDAQTDEERAKKRARELGLTDDDFKDPVATAARLRAQNESKDTTAKDIVAGVSPLVKLASGASPLVAAGAAIGAARAPAEATKKREAQAAALAEIAQAQAQQEAARKNLRESRLSKDSDELTRNSQEQSDLRKAIVKNPIAAGVRDDRNTQLVALQKRAIEITESIGTFRQKDAAAQQATAELAEAKKVQALKETEINLDHQIAAARQQGLETASLEMEKQIKLLEKQRNLATTRPQERRAIDAQIESVRSYQAQFRQEVALKRERDTRLSKGDTKGAQAITDFLDLKKLTGDYLANGLTAGQAKADFATDLRAKAFQNQRTIVVDSLQAVGGGGGVSANPGDAIAARIAQLNADQLAVLRKIEDAVRNGPGMGIN